MDPNDWTLTGNAGTDPTTNFLGTTDHEPLVIRTNGAEHLRITPDGNVGIGTPTPGSQLDVAGGGVAVTATGGLFGLHAVGGGTTPDPSPPITQAAIFAEGGPNYGIYATSSNGGLDGVFGSSTDLNGVSGFSTGTAGVQGSWSPPEGSSLNTGAGVQGVNPNGTAIRALSFNPLSHTSIAIGREGDEGRIGVAAAAGQFANDAVAGDIILRTETPSQHLLFGNGTGNSALAIVNGNVGIGTTTPGSQLEIQARDNNIGIHAIGRNVAPAPPPNPDLQVAIYVQGGSNEGIFAINNNSDPEAAAATISGINLGTSPGITGTSESGIGVAGSSISSTGVQGFCVNGIGVAGRSVSSSSSAVFSFSQDGVGVRGESLNGTAGVFDGFVVITRDLTDDGSVIVLGSVIKAGGGFLIDHPKDPAHKSLFHSFVESPDMKNIYDGIVVLNAQGEAEVTLPAWFDALNTDFRYQLTAIGASGPDLYIAEEISANRFKIAGGKPNMKVSWQVTGIRQDAWAKANRFPVEQDKPAQEHGFYRHPELYGESEQKGIAWLRHPRRMQQMQRMQEGNRDS